MKNYEDISNLKLQVKSEFAKYKDIVNQLNDLGGDENQRLLRLDVLKYQVNEIEGCALKDGEEESLIDIRQKLVNQEKIVSALNELKSIFSNENGVCDALGTSIRSLNNISNLSSQYSELYDRLNNVFSEVTDIESVVSSMIEDIDDSDVNIDFVENRLDKIKLIKKKYGTTYNEINEFLINAKNEIEKLENFNDVVEKLIIEKEKEQSILYNLYKKLSDGRKFASEKFAENIINELRELGMNKACFEIKFAKFPQKNECVFNSNNGVDDIEFMFSANAGEPLKSLSSVISGGEMSRFMLSIKTQTAKHNEISTFIFDEIDAGISGITAKVVAEKFAKISKDVQIIAISHLPQISSMADNNLLIEKIEENNSTNTIVKSLSEEEKIVEIIRLIGGEVNSSSAVLHAKELISQAYKFKQSI